VTLSRKRVGVVFSMTIHYADTFLDLGAVHARAVVYDNRVEHLWTYAQVASAMMMSIAHGSNDGKLRTYTPPEFLNLR
jgi:phosphate/sulfate permease